MDNGIFQALLYLFIVLFATTAGALTGMGGGVIIKPILDMLGNFDALSISMLSSITVFSMASVSVFGHRRRGKRLEGKIVAPLAVGAAIGGMAGDWLVSLFAVRHSGPTITVVQNAVLALLIAGIFMYMRNKDKVRKLNKAGIIAPAVTGAILGVLASFLGVGGGPINAALIIFVFGFETSTATVCSLVIIWFSQAAKLVSAAMTGGFGECNLTMLPPMIIGALCGGIFGGRLQSKMGEAAIDRAFNVMQGLIFVLCIWNIVRNI